MEIKNTEEQIDFYLKKLKGDKVSQDSILKKREHLHSFSLWLKRSNREHLKVEEIAEKEMIDFKEFLLSSGTKERSINPYIKTIEILIRFYKKENKESDVQQIVNHYFLTKGYSLEEIKESAKKGKIIYSRFTRPAKDLLELAGSLERAKKAIDTVSLWAKSRNLDYAIETVFKKWPEINKLKPKEKKLKPFYLGDPMVFSNTKKKWYVINQQGDWLEFAADEKEIVWKEEE